MALLGLATEKEVSSNLLGGHLLNGAIARRARDMVQNEVLKVANEYVERGWSVLPIRAKDKKPAIAEWKNFQTTLPTIEQLDTWFSNGRKNLNLGIVTGEISGLVVLDVDEPEALGKRELPATPCVKTGKGLHYYYRHPGVPVRNFVRKVKGLDLRADGGYVVSPPSTHSSGVSYEWLIPPTEPLAEIPEWLRNLITQEKNGNGIAKGKKIVEGHRNNELTSFAGSLRRNGLSEEDIYTVLEAKNAVYCNPPLEKEEVRQIAASVAQYPIPDGVKGQSIRVKRSDSIAPKVAKLITPKPRGGPTDDELVDKWFELNPDSLYGLGGWRRYDKGWWAAIPDLEIKTEMQGVVRDAKSQGVRPSAGKINSVHEMSRQIGFVRAEKWDRDTDILVCTNGTLHIPTMALREHKRKDYATGGVPFAYNLDARCPTFERVVRDAVGDAGDFLQEFAGYCATTDTSLETAVWLYGDPGGGKSKILLGLQTMLGIRCGTLGLASIERSRFALSGIIGKTLLVASEQPAMYMKQTHILNALISGEIITIEQKYKDAMDIIPKAKLMWAMNSLPRVGEANSGLFRRVKVIEVPSIPEELRDPTLKEKIEKEGAGILNWALRGLARLNKRGYFVIPDSVTKATKRFKLQNDKAAMFLEDACEKDVNLSIGSKRLYDAYRNWCESRGHKSESMTRMANEWRRLGFENEHTRKGNRWCGLGLLRSTFSTEDDDDDIPI